MKTENPYHQNGNTLLEVYQCNAWQDGYAAAMADNAPKRFDKQLPPDNIGLILLINYRTTFVVWEDYDCSAITRKGYEWDNENGDGDTYYFTHWLPFPCVSPKSIT